MVNEVKNQYLPSCVNITTLLNIIYVQKYIKLGFEYKLQLTLTQTNCTEIFKYQICIPQPYTAAVVVEALITILPWLGTTVELKIISPPCEIEHNSWYLHKNDHWQQIFIILEINVLRRHCPTSFIWIFCCHSQFQPKIAKVRRSKLLAPWPLVVNSVPFLTHNWQQPLWIVFH